MSARPHPWRVQSHRVTSILLLDICLPFLAESFFFEGLPEQLIGKLDHGKRSRLFAPCGPYALPGHLSGMNIPEFHAAT